MTGRDARWRAAAEEALAWFELNRRALNPPTDKSDIAVRLLRRALAPADEPGPEDAP